MGLVATRGPKPPSHLTMRCVRWGCTCPFHVCKSCHTIVTDSQQPSTVMTLMKNMEEYPEATTKDQQIPIFSHI